MAEDEDWIVPKKLNPLPQYNHAGAKDELFVCVKLKCKMAAHHCVSRQMVAKLVILGEVPKWTHTKTVCASGHCRQGNEMRKEHWAQLLIASIEKDLK